MSPHLQVLTSRFEGLRDTVVSSWSGVEMALTEGRQGGDVWEDSTIPYLQMLSVDLVRGDGSRFRITTEQADDLWGLSIREFTDVEEGESNWSGIFRDGALDYLPFGRISNVELTSMGGLIDRVCLSVGRSRIQFVPGEVYEQSNGSLRVATHDESILVQVDGAHPRQNKAWVDNPLPAASRRLNRD